MRRLQRLALLLRLESGGLQLVDLVLAAAGGDVDVAAHLGRVVDLAGQDGVDARGVGAADVRVDRELAEVFLALPELGLGIRAALLGIGDIGLGLGELRLGLLRFGAQLHLACFERVELGRDLFGLGLLVRDRVRAGGRKDRDKD